MKLFLSVSFLTTALAADYFPPPDAKGGWRTLTEPNRVQQLAGIDVKKLDQAFDFVQ